MFNLYWYFKEIISDQRNCINGSINVTSVIILTEYSLYSIDILFDIYKYVDKKEIKVLSKKYF